MKHAFLIATHNNEEITKRLLSLYDTEDIDFYIHVDKKAKSYDVSLFDNLCKNSKVFFISRTKIYWGSFSQIQLELLLLNAAIVNHYDYYHLISGCDVPLMTKSEFLNFFIEHQGQEFVEYAPEMVAEENNIQSRIQYYHFFMNSIRNPNPLIRKPQTFLREVSLKIQKALNINRAGKIKAKYGSNWFDITHDFASYVLQQQDWIKKHFHHTCCADEVFLQTILYDSLFYEKNYYNIEFKKRKIKWGRHVDWNRGDPYVFKSRDFKEICNIHTSFFIRKFDFKSDPDIVMKLFHYLEEREAELNV
ncbi:beta-1,6-N-acetylglucosaminyltransferase [[Clostridium] innocuum]|nr:beta-1,6-N-acetylglucosaminyltransferase [[Clostridium] innocuum]